MRNVEIKARVRDVRRLRELAAQLSGAPPERLQMCDTFYGSGAGRLKQRELPHRCQLIFYERPDGSGPRLSDYSMAEVAPAAAAPLQHVLRRALGVRGQVSKTRLLYMVGQTRVHLDSVEGLGEFMELEVQLAEGQTPEEGRVVAEQLMQQLGVCQDDLVSCAYIDMLDKQNTA